MANVNRVNGARPVKHLDGSPYNGAVNRYYLPAGDATATFVGDFVKSGGTADADGVPTIAQAAAGDPIRGVIVAFEPDPDNLGRNYRPASTARYALVADAPDLVFEIQEDAVGGALAITAVGNNADIVVGSGNTTSGASGMQLDTSDIKTATAQLRILGFVQDPKNEVGVANAKVLVSINEHELKSTTGV